MFKLAILNFIYPLFKLAILNFIMLSFLFPVIDDSTKEIVYRDYVDISVAVSTPKVRLIGYLT